MRISLWFALLALVVCALVNPGNFGTVDTKMRLQVARWIRLKQPEVSSAGGFGLMGKDGIRHAWYGVGQSLALLPFDAAVSAIVPRLFRRWNLTPEKQEQLVELLIAFLMQFVVTSAVLILSYHLLLSFGFSPVAGAAGALALLFGTTCLQYVQMAQENELLLALDLAALWGIRQWTRAGAGWAVLAGAACGFAILTRLPSVLDALLLACLAFSLNRNWSRFLAAYLPPILAALALDRWYQWLRFGEFWSTYMTILGRQARPPGAPASYPFSYPFWKGFLGTIFSPDKAIVLFDPLLLLVILLATWRWQKLHRELRLTLLALLALLAGYLGVYAKYFDFGGDVAWGHRFVLLPVELLALFAIPLLLAHGRDLKSLARKAAWAFLGLSIVLQIASTALSPNLEVIQRDIGYNRGVVWNRTVNLVELSSRTPDPARFRGIPAEWRSLYYFPFQLRFRYPRVAVWSIRAWWVLALCLPFLVISVLRAAAVLNWNRARSCIPVSAPG
jgi:hypothetical protein